MRWLLTVACFLVTSMPARAQRPILYTEEPATLGDGNQLIGGGFEYLRKSDRDVGVPWTRLWKVPEILTEFGVGERVNVQLYWRGGLFAESPSGTTGSDYGDLSIATKILILRETQNRPAFGVNYSVKLPNTKDEEGLGSDNTDVYGALLFSKKFGMVTGRLNLGLGILGDPRRQNAQDDIYVYGAAFLLRLEPSTRIFVETTGFFGPLNDDDKLVGRLGLQIRRLDLDWTGFWSVKLSGTPLDFGTAFELSERWGAGIFVSKQLNLW